MLGLYYILYETSSHKVMKQCCTLAFYPRSLVGHFLLRVESHLAEELGYVAKNMMEDAEMKTCGASDKDLKI